MNTPLNPSPLSHLHRWLPGVLWGVVIGGLIWVGQAFGVGDILGRLELTLLDVRLKMRSEMMPSQAPSDQIIVIGVDRQTQEFAVNHPELHMDGIALPRERVAQIVNFMSHAGAKAIVLDAEFKVPVSEAGDRALAEAVRKANNVYLASSMELPFAEYQEKRRSQGADDPTTLGLALTKSVLMPYLNRQANSLKAMGFDTTTCERGYWSTGVEPINPLPALYGFPPEIFHMAWRDMCASPASESAHETNTVSTANDNSDLISSYLRDECQTTLYSDVTYQKRSWILPLFDRHALTLSVDPKTPLKAKDALTYCVTNPILQPIFEGANGMGVNTVDYADDMQIRKTIPVFFGYRGQAFANLGLRPILDWPGNPITQYASDKLILGNRDVPLINGRTFINWRAPKHLIHALADQYHVTITANELDTVASEKASPLLGYGHLYRMVSASDILQATGNRDTIPGIYNIAGHPESGLLSFKNKIVIYGDAVKNTHRTPVGSAIYGSEILANVLDMFWHDKQFIRPVNPIFVGLSIVMMSILLLLITIRARQLQEGIIGSLFLIAVFGVVNFVLFVQAAYWMPLVNPTMWLVFVLIGGIGYRYIVQDREKRQLANVFSKYVSPQVMDQILENPENSLDTLAGKKQNLTVLFADLRGFTSQCETEDLEAMVARLNEFFDAMTRIILKHQGTYDKFIGDAVMAFFGAPVDIGNHALKACEAAYEMHEALAELNRKWEAEGFAPLAMGVGVSTGEMIVGNFGADNLKSYTVMGTAVNLGARLESQTRPAGVLTIISEETHAMAGDQIQVTNLGPVSLKGISQDVIAYSLEQIRY